MVCVCVVIYRHQFLMLCVACDTVPTAGMTEGAELGNETNCLHFLRAQPLQGTPMNITQLKQQQICDSGKIMTRMRENEVKSEKEAEKRSEIVDW